jgi:tetratricopeptide (TPR) repeat protein
MRALSLQEHEEAVNLNRAILLMNLARIYEHLGRYDQEVAVLERGLAIYEKQLGPNDLKVADFLRYLGSAHNKEGAFREAEEYLLRAIRIYEQEDQNHPELPLALNSLGTSYSMQGRYSEAEVLLKRAIVLLEQTLGPNHPYLEEIKHNLAAAANGPQGQLNDAACPSKKPDSRSESDLINRE